MQRTVREETAAKGTSGADGNGQGCQDGRTRHGDNRHSLNETAEEVSRERAVATATALAEVISHTCTSWGRANRHGSQGNS